MWCVCVCLNNVSETTSLHDSHLGPMSAGKQLPLCVYFVCVCLCVFIQNFQMQLFSWLLLHMCVCVWVCIWARGWYRPQPKRKEQLVCQLKDVIKHEMGCQHHVGRGSEEERRRVCVCIYLGVYFCMHVLAGVCHSPLWRLISRGCLMKRQHR